MQQERSAGRPGKMESGIAHDINNAISAGFDLYRSAARARTHKLSERALRVSDTFSAP